MSNDQTAVQTAREVVDETGIVKNYSVSRLRQLGAIIRKNKGGLTSNQTRAFLSLHGEELSDLLDTTVREFLEKKLG